MCTAELQPLDGFNSSIGNLGRGVGMSIQVLNEQDYYRIVYGGWLGKNIGGTLGAPVEGKKELLELTFYPELPDGPLENDDLDLQLVCLHALEQYGPRLTSKELGQEWLDHVFFPFDEYGYAVANLRRGLVPPVSGWLNNPFTDCMGSPIRSEIWAMVSPGAPNIAAQYAYQDAVVDHAGGEGVYGEMFFAAIESAIFYEKEPIRLIEIGLSFIPKSCRVALAVKDLVQWHSEGVSWTNARDLILNRHGHDNFSDAPQNIAFTMLGFLYGDNFEDAILKAVNCGYDTDCTAATLGAMLGMILGPEGLPDKWVKPVGNRVVVSPPIHGFPAPHNLDELTQRTIRMGKQVLAVWDTEIIVHPDLPTSWNCERTREGNGEEIWSKNVQKNHYLLPQGTVSHPDLEITIDFGDEGPAIGVFQTKDILVNVTNRSMSSLTGTLRLDVPNGWESPKEIQIQLHAGDSTEWKMVVRSSEIPSSSYELGINWTRYHNGNIWSTQRVPFALVSAAYWEVWGPNSEEATQAIFPGNKVDWHAALNVEMDGLYRARTKLSNPSERLIRLIAAANAPVVLKLNGIPVIDCQQTIEFMPAFHRAPDEHVYEVLLPEGTHQIEVEAQRQGKQLEVYVLPISTRKTTTPGTCYYYTDMLFVK